MARGRNGARKKPETSSSVSEGRVWEVPSQKEKPEFNCRHFLSRHDYMGVLPPNPCFERNRAFVLTPTKNIRPRAMGHTRAEYKSVPWGPSLRQYPCWLGHVFCLRFGTLERSFCAHHKRRLHLLKPKNRASNEALFFG